MDSLFVVAIQSLMNDDINLFKIRTSNKIEACKLALVEFCSGDSKESQIKLNSELNSKTNFENLDELIYFYAIEDSLTINCIEVGKFDLSGGIILK